MPSKRREHIPAAIKRAIRERDQQRCQKCWLLKGLDIHHIKPLAKGGTDELDNLTLLCIFCHREWHLVQISWDDVVFTEWLTWPPYFTLLRWFVDEDPTGLTASLTFRESKEIMIKAYHRVRQNYVDDPEEYEPWDEEDEPLE